MVACPQCKGTGRVDHARCGWCGGAKYIAPSVAREYPYKTRTT